MKLEITTARALSAWCRKHRIMYGSAAWYPSAVELAYKRGKRTPCGMAYHEPKDIRGMVRYYLIWRNHTQEQLEESVAFLMMLAPDEIMLVPDTMTKSADIIKQTLGHTE